MNSDNQGSGYGNVGDVLTLSLRFIEKYTAAARTVYRLPPFTA